MISKRTQTLVYREFALFKRSNFFFEGEDPSFISKVTSCIYFGITQLVSETDALLSRQIGSKTTRPHPKEPHAHGGS